MSIRKISMMMWTVACGLVALAVAVLALHDPQADVWQVRLLAFASIAAAAMIAPIGPRLRGRRA